MTLTRRSLLAAAPMSLALPHAGQAATREQINRRTREALAQLYTVQPGSEDLFARARGVLVMPRIREGGFIIGGSYGEGALLINNVPVAYYSLAAASFGLQIGAQSMKQALFFMTDQALRTFRTSDGWELGADAEFTIEEVGQVLGARSTMVNQPIISLIFGQSGLLVGASLQGAKYSLITR